MAEFRAADLGRKKIFTVDEYHRMGDVGIFMEDDHVELLEGEIFWKYPLVNKASWCLARLNSLLQQFLENSAVIFVRSPIYLNDASEPVPDLAVVSPDAGPLRLPMPIDIFFLVEVTANKNHVEHSRDAKISLYGRHRIPESWLINSAEGIIQVYRQPSPSGYRQAAILRPGDRLSPLAFPDLMIEVSAILG